MAEPKPLIEYIDAPPSWWTSHLDDYQASPATAFLGEAVHIADALNQCKRRFARKKDGRLNKDGQDSIYRLCAAAFSSLMSHFETYERSLFAGMLEASRWIPDFKLTECCRALEVSSNLSVDVSRLLAYRGRTAPIGQVVADCLTGWHNPQQVNSHFKALVPEHTYFSNRHSEQLHVLWQLRHSIVHSGGWLTHADAQKVPALLPFAEKPILLNENFLDAVAKRLHNVVLEATANIGTKFKTKASRAEAGVLNELFTVRSRRSAWLA